MIDETFELEKLGSQAIRRAHTGRDHPDDDDGWMAYVSLFRAAITAINASGTHKVVRLVVRHREPFEFTERRGEGR